MDPFDEAVSAELRKPPRPKTMGGGGPTFQPGFPIGSKKDIDSLRNEQEIADGLAARDALRYPDVNGGSYSNSTAAPSGNAGQFFAPGTLGENPNIDTYQEEAAYQAFGNDPGYNPDWTHAQNTAAMAYRQNHYDRLMRQDQENRDRKAAADADALEQLTGPGNLVNQLGSEGHSEDIIRQAVALSFPNADPALTNELIATFNKGKKEAALESEVISIGEDTTMSPVQDILDDTFTTRVEDSAESVLGPMSKADWMAAGMGNTEEAYDRAKANGTLEFTAAAMNRPYEFTTDVQPGRYGASLSSTESIALQDWVEGNSLIINSDFSEIEAAIDSGVPPVEVGAMVDVALANWVDTHPNETLPPQAKMLYTQVVNDYTDRRNAEILQYESYGVRSAAPAYAPPSADDTRWSEGREAGPITSPLPWKR